MIADAWTVMWKEWRELLLQRGNVRGGWVSLLITIGVFGIFLPLQSGRAWVESPALLLVWVWVPLFLVSSVVADAIAGERERHTLETLLASRLSDRSILVGKVGAAMGYGWGLTLVMLTLGLVTVNVVHGHGELVFYPPATALGAVLLTLLGAGLVSGAGVLVSLHAATVRQAAQTLSIAIMVLLFLPVLALQIVPAEWKGVVFTALGGLDTFQTVLLLAAVLLVVDLILLLLALARFQRAKLILD